MGILVIRGEEEFEYCTMAKKEIEEQFFRGNEKRKGQWLLIKAKSDTSHHKLAWC